MFSVGQRVRCVNGSFPFNALDWATRFPAKGEVYTIRRVANQPHYLDRSFGSAVWLEEIVNPPLTDGTEPSFSAWRFRPLVDATANLAAERGRKREPQHTRLGLSR